MKRMVSVWLPAWSLERLQREHPQCVPRDMPFALVQSGQRGIRITAVNAKAAREGVRPGLSLADARASLPQLASRPAEPDKDDRALRALSQWCGRYGPARNTDASDGIWIDITGVAHLFSGEALLLADLCGRLQRFGITARAAAADTFGAAHALARFAPRASSHNTAHDIFIAPPGCVRRHLSRLPVGALRLNADDTITLRRLGLATIGQLYDLPRTSVERRFRARKAFAAVLERLDMALGAKPEPKRALREPPILHVQRSWPDPLISAETIEAETGRLAEDLAAALDAAGLGCSAARLSLYRADGTVSETMIATSQPTRNAAHLMRLFREKFGAIDAGFGIDIAAMEAVRASGIETSQGALTAADSTALTADPAHLVDRLTNRLGALSVRCLAPRETHIPERAQTLVPALSIRRDVHIASSDERAREPRLWPQPRHGLAPRPLMLLPRPERIDVMAEIPEGAPMHFKWRRLSHRVVRADGPERIAPEWWRTVAPQTLASRGPARENSSVENVTNGDDINMSVGDSLGTLLPRPKLPRTRDYYRLEVNAGGIYWVFRAGLYSREDDVEASCGAPPRWYVHGVFA